MTKILVDTNCLRDLLASNPHVEMELTGVAAEKIAEELKRKIGPGYAETVADNTVKRIETMIRDKFAYSSYNLSSDVSKIIREVIDREVKNKLDDKLLELAVLTEKRLYDRMKENLDKYQKELLGRIDGHIANKVGEAIGQALTNMMNIGNNKEG